MSIERQDLRAYGSATRPLDDVTTQIGGAIARSVKVEFFDVSGAIQALSSAAGDSTQSVTMHYKDSAGGVQSEVKALSGQTPVGFTGVPERLLRGTKSATCAGDVAIEAVTADRAGTAQAGAAATITLDAGASAVDDAYLGKIIRITAGTGIGQIREIIAYAGTSKVANVDRAWGTIPDATSVFRVVNGIVFAKAPTECMEVTRPFYLAGANPTGGAAKEIHEKIFLANDHATLALTTAQVIESSDPSGLITFLLAATVDDNGTNGAGNTRLVAPAGTFDSTTKNVPGTNLAAGAAIGVWMKLSLAAGAAAQKTQYLPQLIGNTT